VKRLARAFLIGAPLVCAACSSKGASPAAAEDAGPGQGGAGAVSCGVTTDTYVANLTKPGKLGKYTFTLVQGVPAPPDLDGNVWTMKIVDASGAPPILAQVMAYPYMPQMGHSSDQTPQVAANADGTFAISDIYLFMPGLWTITLSVLATDDAGTVPTTTSTPPIVLDEAVYTFCVDD
jgi:hypothetical protein